MPVITTKHARLGTTAFTADFSTGDFSQLAGGVGGVHAAIVTSGSCPGSSSTWGHSYAAVVSNGQVVSVTTCQSTTSVTAIAPRKGQYMALMAVDGPASLTGSAGSQRCELDSGVAVAEGDDTYFGVSVYLPSALQTASYQNYGFWQYGAGTCVALADYGVQSAPNNHFMISNSADAVNHGGTNTQHDLGLHLLDQWVDFTVYVHWSTNVALGKIKVWINGKVVLDTVTEQTLAASVPFPKSEFDWYRTSVDNFNLLYMDEIRIGTTYSAVQP
jgi:hypothetical protein